MLLDDFGKICVFKEKTRTPDGEGGDYIGWTDGPEFTAYQSMDTSMEARTAEKQGVTSVYSALVDKAVPIEYGDYFKEKESGTVYRVTSHPDEKQAPKSASFGGYSYIKATNSATGGAETWQSHFGQRLSAWRKI